MKIRNVEILHSNAHPGQDGFWRTVELGKWEPETFDVLDKYLVPDEIFVDIGAWNGVLSLYASNKGTWTHSVECDPKAIEILRENNRLNGNRLAISTCAISDKRGITMLESHNGDWGNSMSTIVDRHEQKGRVEVNTMTLQDFISFRVIPMNKVCLIKIDTEGGECLIIPSSKDFLAKFKPTILLSLHSFWFPDFEKNCTDIIDTIFPIYKVIPIYAYHEGVTLKEHTPETFKEEMLKRRCNDVLLLPK